MVPLRPRCRRLVGPALVATLLAGCSSEVAEGPSDPAAAPVAAPGSGEVEGPSGPVDGPTPTIDALPPEDTAGLAVEPVLAALYAETGTVLTRGALVERRVRAGSSGGTAYAPSDGTIIRRPHLALYLAFADEDLDDLDRYLDAVVPLTRTFAGAAFERWPDLASFDICLVPSSDSDASPEPAIVLVDVTRDGYAAWVEDGADLVGLRAGSRTGGSGVRLELSEPLRALVAERDAAGPA